MQKTLLAILPLALAASLSPTSLLVESAIISGAGNGRKNSLLFVIGATLFSVALGLLVMLVFNHTVLPSDHHKKLSAWIDIILGLLIALMVLYSSMYRRKKKKPAGNGHKGPYLVVGFLFMAVNTSTNIPFVAASKTIADARLPVAEAAVLFVLLVLITIFMMAIPVVLSYTAPARAERVAVWLKVFMERYGARLIQGVFLLVAAYLVWKGIRGFSL